MTSLRIYPLNVGTITRQIANFCHNLEPKIVDLPLICWYIDGSDKRILIDTGGGDPAATYPRFQPYKRAADQSIENALKKIGIGCEDIEIVIATHLHWDHSAGNNLFPNAKIIVQEEELRLARNPFPVTIHTYINDMVKNVEYTIISGDTEITNGVHAILTPGHTYGLQGVLVQGEKQKIFIAGDTYPIFKNFQQTSPVISTLYVDIKSYYQTVKKITDLSAFVLPGHDFGVFEKEYYC
jgi:N-acyl homoserine lactone hydrolase